MAVQNVTIVDGQNAVLPCEIENLGKHKVTDLLINDTSGDASWMNLDLQFDF